MTEDAARPSQDQMIDYDTLDPFKRAATEIGLNTVHALEYIGATELTWSRGESCYLLDHGDFITGHVTEGLGTKNLLIEAWVAIARDKYGIKVDPYKYYAAVAQDCVAMIVNDMITLGISPRLLGMHLAVGSTDWFDDERNWQGVLNGWAASCVKSGAVFGPGETPTLKDIVAPGTIELSGFAMGMLFDKDMLVNPVNIQAGDRIIGLASSGIHANGLTKARMIAKEFGYDTVVPGTEDTLLDRLLRPTRLYVSFLHACQHAGVRWSYGINVTGHGWRKIMRAVQPFTYHITDVPEWLPEFQFMADSHNISPYEMYETFNMGIGFVVIVRPEDEEATLEAARKSGDVAMVLGPVEQGSKQVLIDPYELVYGEETLQVR